MVENTTLWEVKSGCVVWLVINKEKLKKFFINVRSYSYVQEKTLYTFNETKIQNYSHVI